MYNMYTNVLQPCILEPTRFVDSNKPSLVDNIFTNAINKNIIRGNLLTKLSDHMPNFSFALDIDIPKERRKGKIEIIKTLIRININRILLT